MSNEAQGQKQPGKESEQLVSYAGDVDEITDADYHQPDAGKRLRNAFVWVGDEFRHVTTDSPTGTRMDFSRAKTPPPSPLAIQIAKHYAMRPPVKRNGILQRPRSTKKTLGVSAQIRFDIHGSMKNAKDLDSIFLSRQIGDSSPDEADGLESATRDG